MMTLFVLDQGLSFQARGLSTLRSSTDRLGPCWLLSWLTSAEVRVYQRVRVLSSPGLLPFPVSLVS